MDRYRARARFFLLGAALIGASGCNLTDTDPPSSAHFKVTASSPVRIITSTEFILSGTEAGLVDADTVDTAAKEANVDLPSPPRFFIRVLALTPGTQIALRVDVGKRNWYDASRTLAPPDKLEFVYGFTGSAF